MSSEISCLSCRALCCRLEVPLIDEADDAIPSRYTNTEKTGRKTMKQREDGWCVAVDPSTFRCTIYEHRPYLCREYQTGDFDCVEERAKFNL